MESKTYKYDITVRIAEEVINIKFNFYSTYKCLREFICSDKCKNYILIDEKRLDIESQYLSAKFPLGNFSISEIEYNAVYRDLVDFLLKRDVHLFHGVLLKINNEGILFMAPSGTGKSTHAMLWKKQFEDKVTIINGDKPLLKFNGENIIAYGSPWRGKEKIGNCKFVCLKKICIIKRCSHNSISRRIWDANLISFMLIESLLPTSKQFIPKQINWLKNVSNKITLYELRCNISDEAVKIAYEGMFL